jgi:hypothetical protein
MAWRFVPAHVNEPTEPVDNIGGILSLAPVVALIPSINFSAAAHPGYALRRLAVIVVVAAHCSRPAAPRRDPLYDLDRGPAASVVAVAGIIVFGSLMGAMHRPAVLQLPLTLDAGLSQSSRGAAMTVVSPRSAKLIHPGARFTLSLATSSSCSGSARCCPVAGAARTGRRAAYAFVGIGVVSPERFALLTRLRARSRSGERAWRRAPRISSAIWAAP